MYYLRLKTLNIHRVCIVLSIHVPWTASCIWALFTSPALRREAGGFCGSFGSPQGIIL